MSQTVVRMSLAVALFVGLDGIGLNAAYADTGASEMQQAQAMQFGMFFGGSATQYDECVRRGFVPSSGRSAEDAASLFLKTSQQVTRDKEGSDYALKGWEMAKQKILEQPPEHWKTYCPAIAQQWNSSVTMLKLQWPSSDK